MRDYCLNCVIKHLGQAFVLNLEVENGYPQHQLLVIGHLAEASEECYGISKELSNEIRQHRLLFMDDVNYSIPYFSLYKKTKELIDSNGCGKCDKASEDFKSRLNKKIEENKKME